MTRTDRLHPAPPRATSPRPLVAAAGAFSLLHLLAGLAWTAGAGGYPFVQGSGEAFPGPLTGLDPATLGPLIAVVGAATLLALVGGQRLRRSGPAAVAVVAVLVSGAAAATLLVPEIELLAALAYTPVLLAATPLDWPEGASLAAVWTWPLVYQALTLAGGLLWAASAVDARRRAAGACGRCGRRATPSRWTNPVALRRWGGWAVAVAVAVPLIYAATRFAWAAGLPLGISEAVLREGQQSGLWMQGAALATLAVAGAALTLGLRFRWGEVTLSWLPLVGGRRVRPGLATIPALIVAALVTAAGLAFWRLHLLGHFEDFFAGDSWAVLGPELLWPAWGAALATAAVAYHLRRRGRCDACGGGVAPEV